jgi:hypothetical protein
VGKDIAMKKFLCGLLATMFVLMSLSVLCRIFGWTWLNGTIWFSTDSIILSVLIRYASLFFDMIFIYLIFGIKGKPFIISFIPLTIILFALPYHIGTLVEIIFVLFVAWRNGRKWSKFIDWIILTTLYGLLISYGRYDMMEMAKYNASIVVSAVWDYKLLYINLYTLYKIGGIENGILGLVIQKWLGMFGFFWRRKIGSK